MGVHFQKFLIFYESKPNRLYRTHVRIDVRCNGYLCTSAPEYDGSTVICFAHVFIFSLQRWLQPGANQSKPGDYGVLE